MRLTPSLLVFALTFGVLQAASAQIHSSPIHLSVSPLAFKVGQGTTSPAGAITLSTVDGAGSAVTLSALDLPSGVTATFGLNPTTDTSTVAFTASQTVAVGAFSVTIQGASDGVSSATRVNLSVVRPILTALTITPSSIAAALSSTQQFTVVAKDQNGGSFTTPPPILWSASGGQAINSRGVFTAGPAPGGPYTVTAKEMGRGVFATARIMITSPPPAPTDVRTLPGSGQITLTWRESGAVTGYKIYRRTADARVLIATLTGTACAYTDLGLTNDARYIYEVSAVNGGAESAVSAQAPGMPSAQSHLGGTILKGRSFCGGAAPNNSVRPDFASAALAFDGTTDTFYDCRNSAGQTGFVGIELGNASRITSVNYAPRSGGYESRMVGGVFEGSNTSETSGYVILATVSQAPTDGLTNSLAITDNGLYRWLRYRGPANSNCNIAEIQFVVNPFLNVGGSVK